MYKLICEQSSGHWTLGWGNILKLMLFSKMFKFNSLLRDIHVEHLLFIFND